MLPAATIALSALLLLMASAVPLLADNPPPFTVGIELPSQDPMTPAEERALREMGIGYVNYFVSTFKGATDAPADATNKAMMALCARLGLDFSISTCEIDPPDPVVQAAVRAGADPARKSRFRGMVFDELEHIRLLNFTRPNPLADYKNFHTLEQAYDESVAGFRALRMKYERLGCPVVATHVFPVLLHVAARAGFIVCPKIQKETYSSVSYAIGMGAAKQYGTGLWADADQWYYDLIPGHTAEELRCNLLMAYWLGADTVYLEGSGFNLVPAGNQGIPFSLMTVIKPDMYQLTPHGDVLRWFTKEYLPHHPRPWTFRDVTPDVAIVHFDVSCWGQRFVGGFTQGLYGTDALPCTPENEAWFQIWNLLTAGKTGRDGIIMIKDTIARYGYQARPITEQMFSYATRPLQADTHHFFVPMNGAVVYDHTAGYDLLKGIPLIFLAPPIVSDQTMEALHRCVKEGAVCVAWGPLAKKHGMHWPGGVQVTPEGKGRWILTDDFQLDAVNAQIWSLLGHPDEIRYRFGAHVVTLRRITDDRVAVEVDGVRQY
jgi:hypothetical protein